LPRDESEEELAGRALDLPRAFLTQDSPLALVGVLGLEPLQDGPYALVQHAARLAERAPT